MFLPRSVGSPSPPDPRTRMENHPTLLFSWWCTLFSLVIILSRLGGRYIRTERLFREDRVMALSIIPLFTRMAFVHAMLLYGTNNVDTSNMTNLDEIRMRKVGSRLVLAARISYAAFIWTAKLGVCEFLARLIETFWKRAYEITLRCIRYFLFATFIAVIIATLGECRPFNHYWQVTPDPGPKCRQGYAQLITMGACDIITDILLIVFPIPLVLRSSLPFKRKIRLVFLFSMSAILIGVTSARVPSVINHQGLQQYRTVLASGEILAAAAVSNGVVLDSFLRDRGVKKHRKYKFGSTTDSTERSSQRKPTLTTMQWGSDEDLVRGVGWRLSPEMEACSTTIRPAAPVAPPSESMHHHHHHHHHPSRPPAFLGNGWTFPQAHAHSHDSAESYWKPAAAGADDLDPAPSPHDLSLASHHPTPENLSFFDVGGLIQEKPRSMSLASGLPTSAPPPLRGPSPPPQQQQQQRRGSRVLLQDLSGLAFGSHHHHNRHRKAASPRPWSMREGECFELAPRDGEDLGLGLNLGLGRRGSQSTGMVERSGGGAGQALGGLPRLQDVGGLLGGAGAGEEGEAGLGRRSDEHVFSRVVDQTVSFPVSPLGGHARMGVLGGGAGVGGREGGRGGEVQEGEGEEEERTMPDDEAAHTHLSDDDRNDTTHDDDHHHHRAAT